MRMLTAAAVAAAVASLVVSEAAEAVPAKPLWGHQFGTFRISKIGLKQPLFQGDRPSVFYRPFSYPFSLNRGPAHYPDTPFPWQKGTVMIAGHRLTHTHPFTRLNELKKGDLIVIKTRRWGRFHYRVVHSPLFVTGQSVPGWTSEKGLQLTSCNEHGAGRVVVRAKLSWKRLPKE
jgi:LPXTG-site transpeptidase (sortase) family protein